ncbi:MAG TPA: hypothetical protein VFH85_02695 [Gammaproteobacteria bacterium]|nr:hypothetical protein [Gammaproteobacteria bacterium]
MAAPLRYRLREKLPEILIEAGSVLLALLLAFAANAWHEHHERVELAAQARIAILDELASNRKFLDHSLATLDAAIEQARDRLNSPDKQTGMFRFPYSSLLPSSAAWSSAQGTGAIRGVDYAWTLKIARVYELQNLFLRAQQRVMNPPTPAVVPGMEKAGSPARKLFHQLQLKQLLARMQVLANIGANLKRTYAAVLDSR